MTLREMHRDVESPPTLGAGAGGPGGPGGHAGGNLAARRDAADANASAADAAIHNALSANSQLFNEATQQEGGE